jgi:hypothetical protein
MSLEWEDLLERPFSYGGRGDGSLDCAGVVEQVLVRLGLLADDGVDFPSYRTQKEIEEDAPLEHFLADHGAQFRLIGRFAISARDLGDVAVSDPYGIGCATHVAVLVDRNPRTWLTASERTGVKTHTDRALTRLLGVYRVCKA